MSLKVLYEDVPSDAHHYFAGSHRHHLDFGASSAPNFDPIFSPVFMSLFTPIFGAGSALTGIAAGIATAAASGGGYMEGNEI